MATLAYVSRFGGTPVVLSTFLKLPSEFSFPEGGVISLKDEFAMSQGETRRGTYVLKLGEAEAWLDFGHYAKVSARIESLNIKDLLQLRDIVLNFVIEGSVIPAVPLGDRDIPSIGTIIRADFRRLCVLVKGLLQRVGMKMALQGS